MCWWLNGGYNEELIDQHRLHSSALQLICSVLLCCSVLSPTQTSAGRTYPNLNQGVDVWGRGKVPEANVQSYVVSGLGIELTSYNNLCNPLCNGPPQSEGWPHHGRTVLSPFISVLCHSDWLFHGESCPRLDVVHPGHPWPFLCHCIN